MQTKYTKSFKIEAVKKYLTRSIGETYSEIANSLGVARSSLYGWVKQMEKGKADERGDGKGTPGGSLEKRPGDWGLSEKFDALLDTAHMNEEERAGYCRNQGIFPHHLQLWKEEFKSRKEGPLRDKGEVKALKTEIADLRKELRRKDKALAEAAALLVLKKKVHEIWGNEEAL